MVDFHKRILFSDEAHFWLNRYVNKKTAAFGVKLIHKCLSKHRYIQKNLLFGALYGLVESFFKNDEGHNVTVNGDRYRAMITNFFIPELNNHDVQELWFQQDGATCHTARATIYLLKDTFGDRLISRFGPVNWPPRSCDLTPLDYFLWGYVKSLVYADKPQTFDHLEDNIYHDSVHVTLLAGGVALLLLLPLAYTLFRCRRRNNAVYEDIPESSLARKRASRCSQASIYSAK
ncbi:transposable element Tc3 transposase [Trichonephila clavipes]|nr:transposable element Tc3 transposase [Trichonephila clavipes]